MLIITSLLPFLTLLICNFSLFLSLDSGLSILFTFPKTTFWFDWLSIICLFSISLCYYFLFYILNFIFWLQNYWLCFLQHIKYVIPFLLTCRVSDQKYKFLMMAHLYVFFSEYFKDTFLYYFLQQIWLWYEWCFFLCVFILLRIHWTSKDIPVYSFHQFWRNSKHIFLTLFLS